MASVLLIVDALDSAPVDVQAINRLREALASVVHATVFSTPAGACHALHPGLLDLARCSWHRDLRTALRHDASTRYSCLCCLDVVDERSNLWALPGADEDASGSWLARMPDVQTLVLCGVGTEASLLQTALRARARGWAVVVVEECVWPGSAATVKAATEALMRMEDAGVALVRTVEGVGRAMVDPFVA